MRRGISVLLSLAAVMVCCSTTFAVITRLTALADVIAESTFIVVGRIEAIDDKPPTLKLSVDEHLKGKPAAKRLSIDLTGDARARKLDETPELLKRLRKNQPLVLFLHQRGKQYAAFAFTDGTWFSLNGTTNKDDVEWGFAHLEPYLRRTYAGTTKEIIRIVKDVVSGKRKAPAPNAKEKPGLGPVVEQSGKLIRLDNSVDQEPGRSLAPAIIPTVFVGGPMSLLALLFPAAFGGWRRWTVLLSTAATICSLIALQWWFTDQLIASWWGTPAALWSCSGVVAILGLTWAWQRHLRRVRRGETPLLATRGEFIVLVVTSGLAACLLLIARHYQQTLLSSTWLPVVVFVVAFWLGTAYVVWTWLRGPRLVPALATEIIVLTGLTLAIVALTPTLSRPVVRGGSIDEPSSGPSLELVWTFRLPQKGAIVSSPVVAGDRVLIATAIDSVFHPRGVLYCLDRDTGSVIWEFDDNGRLKQVFSTPTITDDKIYFGEGFHQDSHCKLYCIDRSDGKKIWEHRTTSHTEARSIVADGRVYVGAGDDGLHCLSAEDGRKLWGLTGHHVDAAPVIVGDRVYLGCGSGDLYKTSAVFCLDATTGQPIWRVHPSLPVWSQPIVTDERVYFGTGNGRLNESASDPAGEVLCLRQSDGETIWSRKLPDAVLGRMVHDGTRLYVGCRDGRTYALRLSDGEMVWRHGLNSPIVAGLVLDSRRGRLLVAGFDGEMVCLDSLTGQPLWSKDLAELRRVPIELIATPALDDRNGGRRILVAITMVSTARIGELICWEERQANGP